MKSILDQLVDIYRQTPWQDQKLTDEEIRNLYKYLLFTRKLVADEKDGKLLGYYERDFEGNKCFLVNVYVIPEFRGNGVFKRLYRDFFKTMPKGIEYIRGEKQKLKGKDMLTHISNSRRYNG